jgi:hypothetical protein
MGFERLGNLIKDFQPDGIDDHISSAGGLADRVFHTNHEFQLEKGSKIQYEYLHSKPHKSIPDAWKDIFPDEIKFIGYFEKELVSRIIRPTYPVVTITGDLGCGKTETRKYLTNLVKSFKHCNNRNCLKQRLIIEIDFSTYKHLNNLPISDLESKISSILSNSLSIEINSLDAITEKTEFIDFWEYAYLQRLDRESSAFNLLLTHLQTLGFKNAIDTTEKIKIRRETKNSELFASIVTLDYYIQYAKYLLINNYNCNSKCGIVFIDNIDQLFPRVQAQLFKTIITSAKESGLTFFVFMRNETLNCNRDGTSAYEKQTHIGPEPIDVVCNRLSKFVQNPLFFRDDKDGLDPIDFQSLHLFCANLLDCFLSNKNNSFFNFLEEVSGKSIRIALIMSQNIFRVSKSIQSKSSDLLNHLIRISVRGGKKQYHYSKNSQIEHLLKISTGDLSGNLIKLRILHLLNKNPDNWWKISKVFAELHYFDYGENLIEEAFNDLVKIKRNLIISNDVDYFLHSTSSQMNREKDIKITQIGINYCKNIIFNTHYIQEIMLDTIVDESTFDRFDKLKYLSDKFTLLSYFLSSLNKTDYNEVGKYIKNCQSQTYYIDTFGGELLTTEIIQHVFIGVVDISIDHSKDLPSEIKKSYYDACEKFRKCVHIAENKSTTLLNRNTTSVLTELITDKIDSLLR